METFMAWIVISHLFSIIFDEKRGIVLALKFFLNILTFYVQCHACSLWLLYISYFVRESTLTFFYNCLIVKAEIKSVEGAMDIHVDKETGLIYKMVNRKVCAHNSFCLALL